MVFELCLKCLKIFLKVFKLCLKCSKISFKMFDYLQCFDWDEKINEYINCTKEYSIMNIFDKILNVRLEGRFSAVLHICESTYFG